MKTPESMFQIVDVNVFYFNENYEFSFVENSSSTNKIILRYDADKSLVSIFKH